MHQTTAALAVASEKLRFSHGDLHELNILLSDVDEDEKLTYRLRNDMYQIPNDGVRVKIIDYGRSKCFQSDHDLSEVQICDFKMLTNLITKIREVS